MLKKVLHNYCKIFELKNNGIKIHNLVNQQLGKPKQSYENMRFRYTNQSSTERVRQSFIKWTSIMKVNVVKGDLKIQRSYGTLLSFIFNYV